MPLPCDYSSNVPWHLIIIVGEESDSSPTSLYISMNYGCECIIREVPVFAKSIKAGWWWVENEDEVGEAYIKGLTINVSWQEL